MTPIERTFISFAAAVLFVGIGHVARIIWQRRVTSRLQRSNDAPVSRFAGPALLYFHTDGCAPCRTQELNIREVQRSLAAAGRTLRVMPYDALAEARLVRDLHVVTVPTTVVIGENGDVVAWNPGLTGARTILDQVRPLVEPFSAVTQGYRSVTLGERRSAAAQLQ